MHDLFSAERPHLVVLGLMGVGKSTTAEAIGTQATLPVFDSDVDIETLFAMSGGELAAKHGIDELHRIESSVLLGRLAADEPSVISAAAWTVEDARSREAMAHRARVVVLQASTELIMQRMATGEHRRPMDRAELERLVARRAPLFETVADRMLDATTPTSDLVMQVLG